MYKECSILDCKRKYLALGYCNLHYKRYRKGTDLNLPLLVNKNKKCSIPECNKAHKGLGYCNTHYKRLKTGVDLLKPLEIHIKCRECSVEGCNNKHRGYGYCKKHYLRFRMWGDPNKTLLPRNRKCSIEGCNKKHYGKNYCQNHYNKYVYPHSSRKGDLFLYIAMMNVRKRDNNECKWYDCGKSSSNRDLIHVHHIFPQSEYPEFKYIEEYMICYCKYHHAYWHEMRGDIRIVGLILN